VGIDDVLVQRAVFKSVIYILIMSNVLKLGKKILTVSTVFSTMLWSVGVATLVPFAAANADTCPSFQSGNLIKVVGHPAIYSVSSNGKLLYFPSGDEFKSWNVDNTYGGYTSVSQACFDSLPVPNSSPYGVGFRSGATVVKRASSDQLYVVEPNNTLAKITPDAAKALYGTSYKVMTVADVFWPNYTNRGADVTEAKVHPGMLASNGGSTWYVNTDGSLSKVSAAGMTANRFKTAFVHAVADSAVAGLVQGAAIDAYVPAISDRTQTGGGSATTGPGPVVTGGNLTVSLAANNPGANNLASGTAFNEVLKLNLSAGSTATNVTGLQLRKSGFAGNAAITGIELIDAAGKRHGNVASSVNADNDVTLLFAGEPVVVAAGSSQTVTVRINISGAAAGQSGTLQFSVLSAASVMSNGTVGGTFPISGNSFSLQNGSNSVAAVTVTTSTINAAGMSLNVDTANEQEISKFVVAETSSREAIKITSWSFYNTGSAADSDIQDVQLVAQDGTVLATSQQVNKNVVFNLAAPYIIDKGTNKYFTIRAKIVGGANRTVQFEQYNDYDLVVTGVATGSSILPTVAIGGSFPVGNKPSTFNLVTIGNGTLSFNKDVTSPSVAVTPGANGVVLAKFYAKPNGENMELRKIALGFVTGTPTSNYFTGSFTVKVNGASVYSGTPSDIANSGTSLTAVTLSTYPTLTQGQNNYITVEANIGSTAVNGATTTVYLDLTEVKRVISNDIVDPTVAISSGNQVAVQAGALKVTTLSLPVAQTMVVGSSGVTLANIELNAGQISSGEDVKVNSIIITDTKSASVYTNIANLKLYNSSGVELTTSGNTTVNSASTTFSFTQPIVVPKTGAVVLTLKGDVVAQAGETHTFWVADAGNHVSATGVSTGNSVTPSGVGAGQAMTLSGSGSLTVSLVSGAGAAPSVDQTVAVGATNVSVFAFKLTAQNEPMKVTSLTLTASGTLTTVNDLKNLALYLDNATLPFATANQMQATPSVASTTYTWTATDNLLPTAVQPGTPVTVYVKADIGAAGQVVLGDSFRFRIQFPSSIATKGASSGATGSGSNAAAASGITYISPFSVSITGDAPAAGSSVTQAIAAGTQLGRFKITNSGNAKVTITGLRITNGGTTPMGTPTFNLKYSDQNSSNYTANTASSSQVMNVASSTIDFSSLGTSGGSSSFTIDGGSYRYVTVSLQTATGVAAGDSFSLSIASVGDVTYTANELDLGYDATNDGAVTNTASNSLYCEGKPSLGTLVKS